MYLEIEWCIWRLNGKNGVSHGVLRSTGQIRPLAWFDCGRLTWRWYFRVALSLHKQVNSCLGELAQLVVSPLWKSAVQTPVRAWPILIKL